MLVILSILSMLVYLFWRVYWEIGKEVSVENGLAVAIELVLSIPAAERIKVSAISHRRQCVKAFSLFYL